MKTGVRLGDASFVGDLDALAYLSYAGVSPVTRTVRAAVEAVLSDFGRRGRGAVLDWVRQRERLREKLATLLGTRAENLAFTTGTTRGLCDLALSLDWRAGDRIVLFDGEFPANVRPWQNAAELFGLRLERLPRPDPRQGEDALLGPLEASLQHGARLVALSAVQFQTGLRAPLRAVAELCHRFGAELAVDAIQACGVVPLDVAETDIDYLVSGAHKWMMALDGAGFVYARPECAARLKPRTAGWLSLKDGVRFLFEGPGELRYDREVIDNIRYFESGSIGTASFAALEAALDVILELGTPSIFAHVTQYLNALEPELAARGFVSLRAKEAALRSGILSVVPPAGLGSADVNQALSERGVLTTTPDGLLRFAPHFPNQLQEIPAVLSAVDDALMALTRSAR